MHRKLTIPDWNNIRMNYIVRIDEPSVVQLAKEFHVSHGIIGEKCKNEKWVRQRKDFQRGIYDKVKGDIEKETLNLIKKKRVTYIQFIDGLIAVGGNKLKRALEDKANTTAMLSVGEINTLIRLREFLMGTPDSRSVVIHLDKPPNEMTHEERDNLRKKLEDIKKGKSVDATYEVME